MSTKKIFDDMYLFLKEANLSYFKNLSQSIDPSNTIDERNGLPVETYQEVTSHYWNLIYKTSLPEHHIAL